MLQCALCARSINQEVLDMPRELLLTLSAVVIALLLTSCQPLDDEPDATIEKIDFYSELGRDIPLEYGRLVTATAKDKFEATLWFEQADKTVIGVRVNTANGTVSQSVIRITRD